MAGGRRLSSGGADHRRGPGRSRGGLYRYVRNPMYIAVLAIIAGEALVLSRPVLLGYAAAVGAAFTAFVYGYEQPALARRYGAQYEAYRQDVPAWWPRRPSSGR